MPIAWLLGKFRDLKPDLDPALETLLLPFANGALSWPDLGGALFLHARAGWPLQKQARPGLVCMQDFKPQVDALQRDGLTLGDAAEQTRYPLVLVLPPRQREQARAGFVQALRRTTPGGTIVACMPNDQGARSGEDDLTRLAGPLTTQSKHHCRVFWTRPVQAIADAALAAQWRELDAPRPILDGRFLSRPGVFAWDHIDPASALLAAHLPADLAGHGADFGAGWGYLSSEVLTRSQAVTALDIYEADARALALARSNLHAQALHRALQFYWHDVCSGAHAQYDFIVSNPPLHSHDRAARPNLGRAFIQAAAAGLRRGGRLWLVANRHLPYESALDSRFGSVRVVTQAHGFKVIEAIRA